MDHSVTGYGHDSPHAPSRVQVIDSVKAKKALKCVAELKEHMANTRDWNEGWEQVRLTFKKYGF